MLLSSYAIYSILPATYISANACIRNLKKISFVIYMKFLIYFKIVFFYFKLT